MRKSFLYLPGLSDDLGKPCPALLPRRHEQVDHTSHGEREPAAIRDLEEVGDQERQVHDQEEPAEQSDFPEAPFPVVSGYDQEQDRRGGHRAGDCDTVRRRQIVGGPEGHNQPDAGDPERVFTGDVDLADLRSSVTMFMRASSP